MTKSNDQFPSAEPETVRDIRVENRPTTYTSLWSEIGTAAVYEVGPEQFPLHWKPITVMSLYRIERELFRHSQPIRLPHIRLSFIPSSQRIIHAQSVPPPSESVRVGPMTEYPVGVSLLRKRPVLLQRQDAQRVSEITCLQLDPYRLVNNPVSHQDEVHRKFWVSPSSIPDEDRIDPWCLKIVFPPECNLTPLIVARNR
jgi:hypothetical protein